jgi:hypothetical protein
MNDIEKYAISIARPRMCEIALSRFLKQVKDCNNKKQVDELLKTFLNPNKKAKVIQ